MEELESADASKIIDASSRELLEEINQKRRKLRLWPAVGIASLAILVYAVHSNWSTWHLILVAILCAGGVYTAYTRDALAKTVVLFYEFDPDLANAYAQFQDAAVQLARSIMKWHIEASGRVRDKKYHAGASNLVSRKATFIRQAGPPYFKTNIETIAVGVGRQTLYFFPDRLLIYDANGVGAINYTDLRVDVQRTQFIEERTVPSDAEVVNRTWKYVNKSGGPDRRFKDNKEIPVCLYEKIILSSESGLNEVLQLSRSGFGDDFAKALQQLGNVMPKEGSVASKGSIKLAR